MKFKRQYPKTRTVKVDVLALDGYVPISCKLKDKMLLPALGIGKITEGVPLNVKYAEYSPLAGKYVLCADDYFYMSDDGKNFPFNRKFVTDCPNLVEMRRSNSYGCIIMGTEHVFYFNSVTGYADPFSAGVRSCILKNGRIFGVDRTNNYKIKWSGESSYSDWTENISGAGWVVIGYGYGAVLNLALYNDTVVAVREYGLTLLSAYGMPENYKLSYIDVVTPKIYGDTAVVVGGKLAFYTRNGLYSYDGSLIKKVELPLCDDITEPVRATFSGGRYFIYGKSKSLDRSAILAVDIEEGTSYLIDTVAEGVAAGDTVFAYCGGNAYALEEGVNYGFLSGETEFGSPLKKVVKEIILDAEEEVEIEVSNGVNSRILRGVRGKIAVNLCGNIFRFILKSKGKIKSVYAVAEVIDEV